MENYTFKFKEVEINTVLDALATMPYGRVASIIAEIHKQAQEQIQAVQAATQTPTPVAESIEISKHKPK